MNDVLPASIMNQLQKHLRSGCEVAEQGWDAGEDEEDTLTGDLGASLRRSWRTAIDDSGKEWRWRMSYKKFRGRGPKAAEKHLGADGIVQIEIENRRNGEVIVKGLLFQAKKEGAKDKKKLTEQAANMERLAPLGSAVFQYGPKGYSAFDGRQLRNPRIKSPNGSRLGDYLANRFLACEVGKRGLFYDGVRKTLFVPEQTQGVVLVRAALRHRLKIEVQSDIR